MAAQARGEVLKATIHLQPKAALPPHHVIAPAPGTSWKSYIPSWSKQPERGDPSEVRTGFKNPWPSAHKPSTAETWEQLEWGEGRESSIQYAIDNIPEAASEDGSSPYMGEKGPGLLKRTSALKKPSSWTTSSSASSTTPARGETSEELQQGYKAAAQKLLRVCQPDFSFNAANDRAKATWVGHAGVLVQLPPLYDGARPLRILFDPIFAKRCSPSQTVGPERTYPPPCPVTALPDVDLVIISHNHYDHLDFETITALWQDNKQHLHFVVPLGNKEWFTRLANMGDPDSTSTPQIPKGRVTELDWWDYVDFTPISSGTSDAHLQVTCTPAQHGSGRLGIDANSTLWSSWYLTLSLPSRPSFRAFFGGDTGYQFHEAAFPPQPPSTALAASASPYPPCPAFDEIASKLGSPHLLMLPISVGATLAYLRSWVSLSDSLSPFPRTRPGLTSADHMPPWDAVTVFKRMSQAQDGPVCLAMHWGTFVAEPSEVLRTLGQLMWACKAQGVGFARAYGPGEGKSGRTFVALDHGKSVTL